MPGVNNKQTQCTLHTITAASVIGGYLTLGEAFKTLASSRSSTTTRAPENILAANAITQAQEKEVNAAPSGSRNAVRKKFVLNQEVAKAILKKYYPTSYCIRGTVKNNRCAYPV